MSKKLMITNNLLLMPLFWLLALLMTGCSNEVAPDNGPQAQPDGTGRICVTIATPEATPGLTRAVVSPFWEAPDHEWEKIQTFRILICDSENKVVQILTGDKSQMINVDGTSHPYKQSATLTSGPLAVGNYKIYATANYADGYNVGSTVNSEATVRLPDFNGYTETYIPMSGKLDSEVTVTAGADTDAGIITVWRMVGKLQFEFDNQATTKIKVKGIEVEPINQASSSGLGIYLFNRGTSLTSTDNFAHSEITLPPGATTDIGTVKYEPTTSLDLNIGDKYSSNPEKKLFFYVNETDATFTTTDNQFSVRFKIARQKSETEWYDDEIRYGMTTYYGDGTTGQDGFNVIRRNDWIHIPIVITDWQFRIEPLAFVPIAGYPATMLSSDALTATFSTGGMIALQPFVKKFSDATWRDFDNPEVTYVDVSWKNRDGTKISGEGKIVKTPFVYDNVNKCFIGELNNDTSVLGHNYKTTFTVNLKLGSSPQYEYTFTFNIVLQ